jgi:hypothetical protein
VGKLVAKVLRARRETCSREEEGAQDDQGGESSRGKEVGASHGEMGGCLTDCA